MKSTTLIKGASAVFLLTIIFTASAYADSFTFNVIFDGTDYSLGTGPDPLSTDLNIGDDITYILTAADDDYWETTDEYPHFAFLSVTPPITGSRVTTGTVTYSLDGFEVGASMPETFTLAESIVGGIFTVPHLTQFDTITITSHIDSADDASPFQINDYQITDFSSAWVEYVQNPIPGDINDDGLVNLIDAILSLQIVTGNTGSMVQVSSDVNNDGMIGLPEAIFILRHLAAQ